MYICEQILAKNKETSDGWSDVEVAGVTLSYLFNNYKQIILVLSNTASSRWVSLNLNDASAFLGDVEDGTTVSAWLQGLGDLALPTVSGVPVVERKTIKFNDANVAGYKAMRHHAMMAPDSPVTDADKHDVRLYRDNTDYQAMHNCMLFTFNGLLHLADRDFNGIYLKDAGKSLNICGENHIGLISFREIGALTYIPIKEEMLYKISEEQDYSEAVYVDAGVDLSDKIIMLSLGGYLHILDTNYTRISGRCIKISTNQLPIYKRYLESRKYIDLSSMEETWERYDTNNPTYVPLEEFYKDESIVKYLTLSQSFIVAVSADNLYVKRHDIERTGIIGRYRTTMKPTLPLQTEMGRLPEYLAIPEYGIWTICIQDNFHTVYRHETSDWRTQFAVDGSRVTVNGRYFSQGGFLEIGSDVVSFIEP